MTLLGMTTRTPRSQRLSRPVLFLIDDDAGVMHALRDDLSLWFGEDFRVVGHSSAAAGLASLRELANAHEPVALLIVDDDMPDALELDFLCARARHAPVSETGPPGGARLLC